MSKIKFLLNNFGMIFGVLVLFSVAAYAQSVWNVPTATPPGGNTPAPVNVGASNQVKTGGLGVGPLAVFGNALVNGDLNVTGIYRANSKNGINRSCPAGQVLGDIEVSGGIVTGGTCGFGSGGGGGGPVTIVTAYTYSGWGIATCPAGKVVSGGGCYAGHTNCILQHTYPVASNQWGCFWKSCGGVTSNVYAMCQ